MLKLLIKSQLAREDALSETYVINDLRQGQLAAQSQEQLVQIANRPVHLLLSLKQRDSVLLNRSGLRAELDLWQRLFKELQKQDLTQFPQMIRDHLPQADRLLLASDDLVLAWLPRYLGLFMQRDACFYRVQPCLLPDDVFPYSFMPQTDVYALTPKNKDLYFILPPLAWQGVDVDLIEACLGREQAFYEGWSELLKLMPWRELELPESWMAIEVQRIEENLVLSRSRLNESAAPQDASSLLLRRDFTTRINRSRASRWLYQQDLIIPEQTRAPFVAKTLPQAERVKEQVQPQMQSERLKWSSRISKWKEELTNWRLPNIRYLLRAVLIMFAHLRRRGLSKRAGRSLKVLMLAFALILLLFSFWRWLRPPVAEQEVRTSGLETTAIQLNENAIVLAPQVTELEVLHLVKAQELQLRQSPAADAEVLAILPRGTKVWQLAPQNEGWIFVSVDDRMLQGYVYADYLLR